jgi:hypothetical protein
MCDFWIEDDVIVIVVTYKPVPYRLAKRDPDDYGKKNRDRASDNPTASIARIAALACREPQCLLRPIRFRRRMFGKAHTTQCDEIAIDSTLAKVNRQMLRAMLSDGDLNESRASSSD